MTGKPASRGLVFSGVLLMLILGCMVLTDGSSIGMSKNALSKSERAQVIFDVQGELAFTGDKTFYNFHMGTLRKLNKKGEVLWEKDMEEKNLVWMGSGGVLLFEGDTLVMVDSMGMKSFEISGFLEEPKMLEATGEYYLFVGKLQGKDVASLSKLGGVMWLLSPKDSNIISGSTTRTGSTCALNLIDEDTQGQLLLVNSLGEVFWEWKESNLLLLTKALEEGVIVVAENRAFRMDYDGRILWEYPFEGSVCRADINASGYMAVALKDSGGNVYSNSQSRLLALTPDGQLQWSYRLDREPTYIKVDKEYVFILDDSQISILTQHGLLTSRVMGRGYESISLVDEEEVIVRQGDHSKLISISGGR